MSLTAGPMIRVRECPQAGQPRGSGVRAPRTPRQTAVVIKPGRYIAKTRDSQPQTIRVVARGRGFAVENARGIGMCGELARLVAAGVVFVPIPARRGKR
jgi:hypothetical protein